MIAEDKLSSLLSEFARTLLTDFPIEAILDRLVEGIVEVLPISAAGVSLIAPGVAPQYVAASNPDALVFEKLQSQHGEGPCRVAYESGEAVTVEDLTRESRFPIFSAAASAAGLKAAFAFPLRHKAGRLGALDLYRDTVGPLNEHAISTAQTLADVTAAYVLNAHARDEARATSDRFRDSALRDPLTGLPNRSLLQQRIVHAARRAERSRNFAAVLFADLDRFKLVNDSFGHHVGDELLVAVAQRLSALVRPGDTLARVSGDEFVFLCEDLTSADDAEALAVRISGAFAAPFTLAGQSLWATASVGMAYAGPGDLISNQLVVEADVAMYQAKRDGGAGHQIIDLRDAHQREDRSSLEQDLHTAFAERQLDIAYQPVVRLSDGRVTGVEALLRWDHPVRGPVAPLDVVAIAEDNGLISALGAWVLEQSCADHHWWRTAHPGIVLDLAVNVSTRQLMANGFAIGVQDVLRRTAMDPAALVLEVTEAIVISDGERAMTVLADLRELGIRIALDDFGTGYSSLSYLRNFPIDILKIDRSFVTGIGYDKTASAIFGSICDLGHLLDLKLIAEGVEKIQQRDRVRAAGCEFAQGFFYAHPMPREHINDLLSTATTAVGANPTQATKEGVTPPCERPLDHS